MHRVTLYWFEQMHFYIQILHNTALNSVCVCLCYLCRDNAARSTSSHWSADYRTTQTVKRDEDRIYFATCSFNQNELTLQRWPTRVNSPSAHSSLVLEGWRMWRRGRVWEARLQPATTWRIPQHYTFVLKTWEQKLSWEESNLPDKARVHIVIWLETQISKNNHNVLRWCGWSFVWERDVPLTCNT